MKSGCEIGEEGSECLNWEERSGSGSKKSILAKKKDF